MSAHGVGEAGIPQQPIDQSSQVQAPGKKSDYAANHKAELAVQEGAKVNVVSVAVFVESPPPSPDLDLPPPGELREGMGQEIPGQIEGGAEALADMLGGVLSLEEV